MRTCIEQGCRNLGESKGSSGQRRLRCHRHRGGNVKRVLRQKPYRAFVADSCERCGFVPEHPCQLDVDHVNGVHADNRPENLQTLCANCHRLKTMCERIAV